MPSDALDLDPALLREWAATLACPVIFPDDAAYDSARRVWNRAVDLHPAAIVRCAGVDDAVRTLAFAQARGARLAVRSGGHSQAGHGICDGGLVLDLGSFRGVAVDEQRRVARVSSGARVSDVLDATLAHGLVTPMGGCPEVGVGGLTLGGGENFLMGKYGAVVDNLLAADVVTADGQVLRASPDEHADLFWALRGGSGNFGVVTAFEYRLHPVGEVLSGQLTFPVARAREVLLRYRDLARDMPDELQTSGGLAALPAGPAFFVTVYYCGEREPGDRIVAQWLSALQPESDNVKWSTYSSDLIVPAAASVGSGVFLPAWEDEAVDIFASALAEAPPETDAVWNDFHGAVTRVPLDAMAFPLRQRGFDLFFSVRFTTSEAREAAVAWTGTLAAGLRPFSRGVYVNNLNERESHRVPEAYGAHYARLASIKRRYDPDNLLRVNHNVAPDLSRG